MPPPPPFEGAPAPTGAIVLAVFAYDGDRNQYAVVFDDLINTGDGDAAVFEGLTGDTWHPAESVIVIEPTTAVVQWSESIVPGSITEWRIVGQLGGVATPLAVPQSGPVPMGT
jgi:hypothetical protein